MAYPMDICESARAAMPGTITIKGITIFGNAAMSGVRRAADMESAAIARCTTRKSVHQYPNDNTNPSPATNPNTSPPLGFLDGSERCDQGCVITGGMRHAKPL